MYFLKPALHLFFHLVCYQKIMLARFNLHIYQHYGTPEKSGIICKLKNSATTIMQIRIFIRIENKFD